MSEKHGSVQWQMYVLQGSADIRPSEDCMDSCFWPKSHWQAAHRKDLLPCLMLFLLLLSTLWVQCHLREGERTRSWKYPFTTSALIGTDIFSKPLSVKSESRGTPFNDLRFCKSLKSDSRNENLGGSTRQAEHWSTLLAEALIKAECQWRCQA